MKDVVWFALDDSRPLFTFAGIWDRVQRRSRYEIEADPWPAPRLRVPDDVTECRGRAYPSEGDAGDPDDGRGARRLAPRALG
jgi:hypothetical protein